MAIFGTPILPARVYLQAEYIQNIMAIWNSAHASDNYAVWLEHNPDAAGIIIQAEKLADGDG